MASTVSSGRVVEAAPEAAVCGALGCVERRPLYRVRHPSKGERVVCETHARRLAGSIGREAIPKGATFNSSSSGESSSTGRTHSTVGVEETSGVSVHPEHGAAKGMTASDSSPPEGQDGDGVSNAEQVALRLLAQRSSSVRRKAEERLKIVGAACRTESFDWEELARLHELQRELDEFIGFAGQLLDGDGLPDDREQKLKSEGSDGGATSE